MEPWYKVATSHKEVRKGRSFNPDEFAIHLEQVIPGPRWRITRSLSSFLRRLVLRDASGF
jgi:hypothetical protein